MADFIVIDLSNYKPVEHLSFYGELNILDTGSLRPTQPLPNDLRQFLSVVGLHVSLWDGSKGELGRQFDTNNHPKTQLSETDLQHLRHLYLDVRSSACSHSAREKLDGDLAGQLKLLKKVQGSVECMQQDMTILFRNRDKVEIQLGEHSHVFQALSRKIDRLVGEMTPLRAGYGQLKKQVQQIRVQIAENETGYMRKLAILRRIFGLGSDTNLLARFPNNDGAMADAKQAEEESCKAAFLQLQSKRFYVDAKTGMAALYSIEDILKNILQNLQAGMKCMHSTIDRILPGESEKGIEFRLSYVRKLWSKADSAFKTALPYVRCTSLRRAREHNARQMGERAAEGGKKISKGPTTSMGRKIGIFENVPCILPSFTRIEIIHAISRRSKISALHKNAARSYRDVNLLYDFHERMTKAALTELQTRERMEHEANDYLIATWEKLLGV